jgi:hypothetical protein
VCGSNITKKEKIFKIMKAIVKGRKYFASSNNTILGL